MLTSVANQSYIIICSHNPVGQKLSVTKPKTGFTSSKTNLQLISIFFIKLPRVELAIRGILRFESLTKSGYQYL